MSSKTFEGKKNRFLYNKTFFFLGADTYCMRSIETSINQLIKHNSRERETHNPSVYFQYVTNLINQL